MVDNRDKVMANSIVDLLREDDIDKLLAEFGIAHLEGVIANLSEQVALQECDDYDTGLLQSVSVSP